VAPDATFIYTNRAWRETLGYSEKEVTAITLLDVLHPESMACCQDRFARLLQGESLRCIEFKFLTKGGETIFLRGDCGAIVKDGVTVSTRGIFKDITDEVHVEKALKVSEARYQALYENAPDIYATLNTSGEIVSINRNGATMLGYDADELVGESAMKLIHPEDQAKVAEYISRQFSCFDPDNALEYRKLRKDGSVFWVHQRIRQDPDEREPRLLVACRDVNERHQLEQKLAYQASHDGLTNLINRREFEKRLKRVLTQSTSSDDKHALCFLDLDQFKIINDSCGHLAGDDLLRQISALLQGQMRSRDTLARLGGDEFAVLIEHCSPEGAVQFAEKIRVAIENFVFYWRKEKFSLGVSIGISMLRGGETAIELLERADSACYAAKKEGRNCIFVSPMES